MLYPYSSPQPVLPIQIPDSILGIAQILKLTEAIGPLEYNVPDPAVAFEELLHIPVPGILRDVSKVDFVISRHGWLVLCGGTS